MIQFRIKSIKCINELRESAEKENDSFLLNHSDRSKSKKRRLIEDEDEDQNLVIIGKETSSLSLNDSSQRKEIIVETDFDEYNNSSSRKVMNRDYSDDESEESESEEIKKSTGSRSTKKIKNRK